MRMTDTFNRLKSCDSKQIANILANAYNDGLLAVCGGLFEEKDVEECKVALWIAIGMLKDNNIKISKENEG